MALGDSKVRQHVPYRSSKLTHVLKDAIGGACRTTLVACLWPDVARLDQTRATLRFSGRMGRIACAPVARRAALGDGLRAEDRRSRRLRKEVDALRAELAARDLIRGAPPPAYAYGPLDDAEQLARCDRAAKTYRYRRHTILSPAAVSRGLRGRAPSFVGTYPAVRRRRSRPWAR